MSGAPDVSTLPSESSEHGFPIPGPFFFHPDHIGSVNLVTDSSGALVTELNYTPYGELIRSQSSGPDITRYKYTGQEEDIETSLMYYGARYYDAELGRFVSRDSMVSDWRRSQGHNRYMYVGGLPTRLRDPDGHIFGIDDLFVAIIIGATVGATAGGVAAGTHGNIKGWLSGDVKFDWDAAAKGAAFGAVLGGISGGIGYGLSGVGGMTFGASNGAILETAFNAGSLNTIFA
ncbi:MAG: RHS repeat-associated core domain-containing protein [Chloroflexi bacterium]|nr:MAG: RHS repeat-associated core domain-containing protein [Chloroflexota bacterium]